LIKLLTRLWDPTEGEILINDIDIKNYNPEELYEKMSVLFQDYRTSPLIYLILEKYTPLNVAENIAAGDITNYTESLITRAAKDADADPFIQKLPQQYQSKLHDGNENPLYRVRVTPSAVRKHLRRIQRQKAREDDPSGPVELSGGQWQRLALSRAFMRASSADLLILDEPSSSLDPEAEHNLFKYIQQVRRNRTTIYVTHRFYTVRMATKIAFLEEGKLIEWGSHDELIGIAEGKYAKLFQLQSEGFSSLGQLEENGEL
jgi:ATP-binding cassette, subfamily B, bacterial